METGGRRSIVIVIIVVVGLAALAIALLRPTSEITVSGPTPPFENAGADRPVIVSLTEHRGFSLLGITFSGSTFRVTVGFSAPPECADVTAVQSTWPTGDDRCGPPGTVTGELAGGGRSPDGRALVFVEFEVEEDCFTALAMGTTWPPDSASCPAGTA